MACGGGGGAVEMKVLNAPHYTFLHSSWRGGPALSQCPASHLLSCRHHWPEAGSLCCPPQAGKMFNYTHWRKVCDTLFIIFSLVFFYTRLVLFPTQ